MSNVAIFRSFKEPTHKSTSEGNLMVLSDELPLNDAERMLEKFETMKVRKNALEETLEKKLNELRSICLREGELTGTLPKEFPLKENEEPPVIRRRVRTEFAFSDKLLMQPNTKEEEKLTKLELEFEIQCKIVKATSKLCNEMNTKKSIKKQRRQVYQQALAKLKDIEKNLQATKKAIEDDAAIKRKNSMRSQVERSGEQSEDDENLRNNVTMSSAPPTPVKCKSRNRKFMDIQEHQISDTLFTNPRIEHLIKQRHSSNNSPEYDTISSSSLGSANNVFLSNYCRVNNYEELAESELISARRNQEKRSAIAPNLSQDDLMMNRRQPNNLISTLDKYANERLTRHNSLDKMRQQETLNVEFDNRISSTNLLSPNLANLKANQFNFSANNRSQNNINMAQRPLPSPPIEHKKTVRPQQLNLNNKERSYPPLLNLNNPPDHCVIKNHSPSLIKNPLKSPSTLSMLMQSPLDFEKATNLYLQQRSNESSHLDAKNREQAMHLNELKPVRSSVIRTPVSLTINTCSSDLQLTISQQHSPVPLLPPRTPITSKPNSLINSLNPNSINNSISSLNLSSHPKYSKSMMISSNPNLNYTSNSSKPDKLSKGWTETCVDTFVMPNVSNYSNNFGQNYYPTIGEQLRSSIMGEKSKGSMNEKSINLLNEKAINKLNAIKYAQLREKEFVDSTNQVPIRPTQSTQSNYSTNNQFNSNQLIKENSQSSLSSMITSSNSSSIHSSNASSTNLHSFPQVFQPFLEEIKPYELSDFYKYSTKYKNSQKNIRKEMNSEQKSPQSTEAQCSMDKVPDKNDSDHSGLVEDSFLAKNHVANEFSNELKDWLKEKYNKTATLV